MDIVIVSNALDSSKQRLTEQAVYSVKNSDSAVHRIIVVEQQRNKQYKEATLTLNYNFEFNYNKCLNLGIEHCIDNRIALCNNDLIFHKGWASEIIKCMIENKCGSASPYCKAVHDPMYKVKENKIGYAVRQKICGWCIVIDKESRKKIGKLSEDVQFWYSDNIYAEQIKLEGIRHVLSYHSRVDHLESQTLFGNVNLRKYTSDQLSLYRIAKRKLRERYGE